MIHDLECFSTTYYSPKEFMRPLLLASNTNESISHACQYYRADYQRVPSSETMLKSFRNQNMEKMEIEINQVLRHQFELFPRKIRQSFRKHGVVFIDFHDDPY